MTMGDKIKNKADKAVGKVKETVGEVTGNERLEAEGQAEQSKAGIKQAGQHLKDSVTEVKKTITRD